MGISCQAEKFRFVEKALALFSVLVNYTKGLVLCPEPRHRLSLTQGPWHVSFRTIAKWEIEKLPFPCYLFDTDLIEPVVTFWRRGNSGNGTLAGSCDGIWGGRQGTRR
jgi:hypothetical protein